MAKTSKLLATILVLVGIVAIVVAAKAILGASAHVKQEAGTRSKGVVNAPIHVVEFIDFQCPACAKGSQYLREFIKEHPDLVRLEMKYFPLAMHKHAFISSRYAECAARQDEFWPFHDLLLDRQQQWASLINAIPAFDIMASDLKLDKQQLRACLEDEAIEKLILNHKEEGRSLGIKSTPTYFINDKMVVGLKSLEEELQKLVHEQSN